MIKLPFCQNDSPMRRSVWQKDSLITYILFELWIIMTFSSPERKLAKHTSVHYLGRNRLLKPFLTLPSLMGMKQKKKRFFFQNGRLKKRDDTFWPMPNILTGSVKGKFQQPTVIFRRLQQKLLRTLQKEENVPWISKK